MKNLKNTDGIVFDPFYSKRKIMVNPEMEGMSDASRIDLNDQTEIRYWTQRFKISEEELRNVVAKVGIMVDDVVKEFEPGGYRNA